MNWKFWTWLAQLREATEALRQGVRRIDQLEGDLRMARALIENQRQEPPWREQIYARTPAIVSDVQRKRANLERLLVLSGVGVSDPLWVCVLSYADEHARNELAAAALPGLSDADRQYNAGRLAGAEDFASALRELRLMAEREARKQ